jgi:hypothetical protein
MNTRIITFLTVIVLAAMGLILALNLSNLFLPLPAQRYLSFNDVKGIALDYKGQSYTLNFEQQNDLIDHVNRFLAVGKQKQPDPNARIDFGSITVYLFNAPNIILKPIGLEKENLIFLVPEWNQSGYLLDVSNGALKELIDETFDH